MQEVIADLQGAAVGCSRYLRSRGTSWRAQLLARQALQPGRGGAGQAWEVPQAARQGRQGMPGMGRERGPSASQRSRAQPLRAEQGAGAEACPAAAQPAAPLLTSLTDVILPSAMNCKRTPVTVARAACSTQ